MATHKKEITTYERNKNKVKISGDPETVKDLIRFDQRTNRIRWFVLVIISVVIMLIVPKENVIPTLLKLIKQIIPVLIIFVAMEAWLQIIFLSG